MSVSQKRPNEEADTQVVNFFTDKYININYRLYNLYNLGLRLLKD